VKRIDWNRELLASLIWMGESFAISLAGLTVIILLLAHLTVWGRQVRRIAWPYFSPRRSVWPLVVVALVLFVTLFSVRLSVLLSFWRKEFYDSIQVLDEHKFWASLILFCVLASIWVVRSLLDYYIQQAFLIHWRVWLNDRMLERWLLGQAYYRSQFVKEPADNPDQRIQQDVEAFVGNSLGLTMGLVNSVVSLFEFTIILWSLSATLHLFGIAIPRAMVGLVYVYVIFFTVISFWIGRPFIRLRFMNEKLNADYRYSLVRIREYGESIAFYQGEDVEHTHLLRRFAAVISNAWALVYRTLKFYGFNFVIDQSSVVFPFIVQAKRLFSKEITFGDVMQTVQAFGSVYGSLSFFRDSYDQFAGYRAALNRLTGFLDAAENSDALPRPEITSEGRLVGAGDLTVSTPGQRTLLQDLNLRVTPSTPLLVQGPSGAGKTTLLRTLAGLWPYATGRVTRPSRKSALFLSQKPYLPLGTLKGALYYPDPAGEDGPAIEVLRKCALDHLIPRLLEDADWSRILSVGEQQRLAFGRVLLHRPEAVLLDEATSAMDEPLEMAMYSLLRTALPETTIVSVGHRSTLRKFHSQSLTCEGDGRWRVQNLEPTSGPE